MPPNVECMVNLGNQMVKADRLHAITQRVGYALWQLQQLEGATAQYYVLVVEAELGMGLEKGAVLTEKALSKTFGTTITQLTKAKKLPGDVERRFKALLGERNWLVHSSQATSRKAVYEDAACLSLIERLDRISGEALALLKVIGARAEDFVGEHSVPTTEIDRITAETLRKWHGEDTV